MADPTEVVEGAAVSCSCVGEPRVLGTRDSCGTRLPPVGVPMAAVGAVDDVPLPPTETAEWPEMVTTLGIETAERVLKEELVEEDRVKEEVEEAWCSPGC